MFKEGILDKFLRLVKKGIPKSLFSFLAPVYHTLLAYTGALIYSFPSKSLKVIGVTGTKGKSTTVFLITKILEDSGHSVASIGSLGFKIKDKEWANELKMTMPGRFKIQKFLREAKEAGCEYVVMEVTSEGIKQKRHLGIQFDCAVFTNLHKEHIETHGSFEKYYQAKQELFKATKNIHVINADDPHARLFGDFSAKRKIFYGIKGGELKPQIIQLNEFGSEIEVYGTIFKLNLIGEFNVYNYLAAMATGAMYGVDLPSMKPILESLKNIAGRMEVIQSEPFKVVVDYAHTPDSLEAVYRTLKATSDQRSATSKLICVLGAAGGGRDKWKRVEFGKIADKYCDEIILTNEDPYDEDPEDILRQIEEGISNKRKIHKILDRKEAIKNALTISENNDIIIITGKGSETSMALANGEKIPWSDKKIVLEILGG